MLGALIGSLIGAIYSFGNAKDEDREMYNETTVDVALTLGYQSLLEDNLTENSNFVIDAINYIIDWEKDYIKLKDEDRFFYFDWFFERVKYETASPANHYLIAVSLCGFNADTVEDAISLAREMTEELPPEERAAAQITAAAIQKANSHIDKQDIKNYVERCIRDISYYLDVDINKYERKANCLSLIPFAIKIFNNSKSFDDSIRNAIKFDSYNTALTAIVGELAEAYYGIPEDIKQATVKYLTDKLMNL